MADKDKPSQPRSEAVRYASEEVVLMRPVPPSKMEDLIDLQKNLLAAFMVHGGMLGEILRLSNTRVWEDLKKMASLIPLVGGGTLNVEKIDDSEEICRIFFTTTQNIDEETGAILPPDDEPYSPSVIASLNGVNFWHRLLEGRQQAIDRMAAERALAQAAKPPENDEDVIEVSPVEDPALTPSPA
ncbi:MAG TPA: hypothetical protein V6C65_04400 [Allocoleopsis sp.]